ncbi:unnamed protein product, partial [Chrysoparadoxa australica]
LSADLGGALGHETFADIKFVAEGRAIFAHKVILTSQSEYFKAMFRSGMQEGSASQGTKDAVVEVVVPDTAVGILRLLLYLYSNNLASTTTETLLEDLEAADRYQVLGMKQLCQSMIKVDDANCLDVLHVADISDAPLLYQAALAHLTYSLDLISQQPGFHTFISA